MTDASEGWPWMDRGRCPVCESVLFRDSTKRLAEGATALCCSRCGEFLLDDALAATRPWLATDYQHTPILLSHAIQRMQPARDMPRDAGSR